MHTYFQMIDGFFLHIVNYVKISDRMLIGLKNKSEQYTIINRVCFLYRRW